MTPARATQLWNEVLDRYQTRSHPWLMLTFALDSSHHIAVFTGTSDDQHIHQVTSYNFTPDLSHSQVQARMENALLTLEQMAMVAH
jgi:hypothetical protein